MSNATASDVLGTSAVVPGGGLVLHQHSSAESTAKPGLGLADLVQQGVMNKILGYLTTTEWRLVQGGFAFAAFPRLTVNIPSINRTMREVANEVTHTEITPRPAIAQKGGAGERLTQLFGLISV